MNDKVSKIQSLNEEQQQLKKRARRRLVGAIALVLVMVIVLPMILDKQPKVANQDVKIEIPDQESTALPALATPANEVVASGVEVDTTTAPSEPPAAVVADVATEPAAVTAPPIDKKTEAAGLAEAEKKQQQLDAEKLRQDEQKKLAQEKKLAADKKKAEQEKAIKEKQAALAALEAKAADKPEVSASKSDKAKKPFAVQFAALNDGTKAKELLQKLSGHGIRAFVVTVHTDKGEFSKVRAGPFSSREEADYVKKKAEAAGLPALVIAN